MPISRCCQPNTLLLMSFPQCCQPSAQDPCRRSETFKFKCVVCLLNEIVFRKLYESKNTEPGHLVCLECFYDWKRVCAQCRKKRPTARKLTGPLYGTDRCYTLSMTFYVSCYKCMAIRKTELYLAHGGAHVLDNHPGCTLCWDCIRKAKHSPVCKLEGPLINSV